MYPKEYAEKLAEQYGQTLDSEGRVASPGKFEGETWRTIDAYDTLQNGCEGESFGDATEGIGFFFAATIETGETVYCEIDSYGFVSEISERSFRTAEIQDDEITARAQEIESIRDEIREAQSEEKGFCDSCNVANINGVRCHEAECPRYQKLKDLRAQLARLEDY